MRNWIATLLATGTLGGFVALLGVEGVAQEAGEAEGAKDTQTKGTQAKGTQAKGEVYKLVAPLEIIMYETDTMFYAIDEKYLKAKKVKFRTIRKKALFLAEISNLVIHANKEKKWKDYAARNRDDFLELAELSKSKKEAAEKVKEAKLLWKKIETTCETCHEDYRDDDE